MDEKLKTASGEIPQYVSIKEFKARTSLSKATICRRIKAGQIKPVIRVGARVLIGVEALHFNGGADG